MIETFEDPAKFKNRFPRNKNGKEEGEKGRP
jgi:hypothetical protein